MPTADTDHQLTPLAKIEDPEARAAVQRMRTINPEADPVAYLPDVPPQRIPRHVAIIMDGNGRWAKERGLPRSMGHRNGARVVRETMERAGRLGIEALTLYSFSMENWKRPSDEIAQLMQLYVTYMDGERQALVDRNIRFRQIGRREGLPAECLEALDRTLESTAHCTGPTLCLAVNYSSRAEISDAARALAESVKEGRLSLDEINESALGAHLDTTGLPDPDLLVRTAGERRVSNFLLWQISYAEIHVTDVHWPAFGTEDFDAAIRDYSARRRRFGGLDEEPSESPNSR
ncbi:MAG: polyprenyl diphosphate synthase [Planctomycetota bacterium]